MTDQAAPNVAASLFVIHKVLTRSLAVLGAKCRPIGCRKVHQRPSHREGFLNYCQAFVSVLDTHHQIEDLIIFPYFENKLPGAPFVMLTRSSTRK